MRPIVRPPRQRLSSLFIAGAAIIIGVVLCCVLVGQKRTSQTEPVVRVKMSDVRGSSWPEPPPLFIPSQPAPAPQPQPRKLDRVPEAAPVRTAVTPVSVAHLPPAIAADPVRAPPFRPSPPLRVPAFDAPPLIDGNAPGVRPGPLAPRGSSSAVMPTAGRMRASALANPSLTIVQGSLIPAVLETGFDSTSPGFERAIVSHDVRSFDGKNILVPRGSRLVGESEAPAEGQKRATITWTRLIRPDGVTIELDSPSSDPTGGNGVPASVKSNLLSRIGDVVGDAIGDIAQIISARAAPLVVLPITGTPPALPRPSHSKEKTVLKLAPGTAISVFVAHDLDFSAPAADQ